MGTSTRWIFLALALFVLLALTISKYAHRNQISAPPKLGSIPDFSLIQQDGKPLTKSMLLGKPWIASFIFTRCGGQCPRINSAVMALQSDLASIKDLRFVSFSVDPQWDKPEILAQYAQKLGADTARWVFVTGEQETVYKLSREGFKLGVDQNTPDARNIAVEPVFHSNRLVLVDAGGNIRGYYDAEDTQAMATLRKAIALLTMTR